MSANARQGRRKRNFTEDGKFNVEDEREDRDKPDTFYKRAPTIRRKCIELHQLTKCHIKVSLYILNNLCYYTLLGQVARSEKKWVGFWLYLEGVDVLLILDS